MRLQDKLDSIPQDQVVMEFKPMLEQSVVSLSDSGKPLVSVQGYEGHIFLDTFAQKYLSAIEFNPIAYDADLNNRLECYRLWQAVHALYATSDKLPPHDRKKIKSKEQYILESHDLGILKCRPLFFSPTKFKELFPNNAPRLRSKIVHNTGTNEFWQASSAMLEDAIAKKAKIS